LIPPMFRDAMIFAALLSMLSTGLTLTYMTTKVPNFAHGNFATTGIYTALLLARVLKLNIYFTLIPSLIVGGAAALVLYLFVLKPLMDRGANYITLMIATIAYDMILFSFLNIFADYLTRTFKIPARLFILKSLDFRVMGQPGLFIIAPVLAIISVISLYLLLNKTKFGIAMRAAIENPSLASVVGINVNLTYAVSWFISGGLAGMAGALTPLLITCDTNTGMSLIVHIFAASIVGGLTNIYGAFFGGLLIGLAERLGTGYLSLQVGTWIIAYRSIIPLAFMVMTLLFAPKGLTSVPWKKILRRR